MAKEEVSRASINEECLTLYRSRFVPDGAMWFRQDGTAFKRQWGEMPDEILRAGLLGGPALACSPIGRSGVAWLAVDIDGVDDASLLELLPQVIADAGIAPAESVLVLASGTPNSAHYFIPLSRPVTRHVGRAAAGMVSRVIEKVAPVDRVLPGSWGLCIRLPGTVNHKNGHPPRLIHPASEDGDSDLLGALIDAPPLDAEHLVEIVDAPLAVVQRKRIAPCVRSMLGADITERGVRHHRTYAIVAELMRSGCDRDLVSDALMEWFDQHYCVHGTSEAKHGREVEDCIADAAAGKLAFNCVKYRGVFREFCEESVCQRLASMERMTDLTGVPLHDPGLCEHGATGLIVYLAHLRAARAASRRGTCFYYVFGREEGLHRLSRNAARAGRRRLIESGILHPVQASEVPDDVLRANGHRTGNRRPNYYKWQPLPSLANRQRDAG